ncbi:MAG: hypothetical protein KC910_12325 [Candidatus Eremiobacteraeota bacterium]|nr:hypothetical protein [Candidatus Eremiobacteraeota bacterium]
MLEAVVVLAILSIVMLVVFSLFQFGSRGFQHAVLRQGLLGDAQASATRFKADASATHFRSITVVPRTVNLPGGATPRRDAVAFVGLSDWHDPASFFPSGLPRWNRYIVYYATRDDEGLLVRQEIDLGALPGPVPYDDLNINISDLPNTNANVFRSGILSKHVLEFEVGKNEARQVLDFRLLLRQKGGKRVNSNQTVDEIHETVLSVEPMNSYPGI